MENSVIINPVKVTINEDTSDKSIRVGLKLSEEEWETLNIERKSTLQNFSKPFIDNALRGEDKPPFSKVDVMAYLQDNMCQQGILLLAAEEIGNILAQALNDAQQAVSQDPMTQLLMKMLGGSMLGKPGSEDSSEEEK